MKAFGSFVFLLAAAALAPVGVGFGARLIYEAVLFGWGAVG